MSESAFRQSIKKRFKCFEISQVESGGTAPGIPDTHFLLKGTSKTLWGELKFEKTRPNKIDLRKAQVVWNRRYNRVGGKSFVIVKEGVSFIHVWPGSYAKELREGEDIWNLPLKTFPVKLGGWDLFLKCMVYEVRK